MILRWNGDMPGWTSKAGAKWAGPPFIREIVRTRASLRERSAEARASRWEGNRQQGGKPFPLRGTALLTRGGSAPGRGNAGGLRAVFERVELLLDLRLFLVEALEVELRDGGRLVGHLLARSLDQVEAV